jgi:hypothetical protein
MARIETEKCLISINQRIASYQKPQIAKNLVLFSNIFAYTYIHVNSAVQPFFFKHFRVNLQNSARESGNSQIF